MLDEFAYRFYQELDYVLECENGERIAKDMSVLPMVVIPRNYPKYTSRRVHVAEWIDGEKLSQSTADDVGALVNLGVITYLTQLLDKGFFHAGKLFFAGLFRCLIQQTTTEDQKRYISLSLHTRMQLSFFHFFLPPPQLNSTKQNKLRSTSW